MEYTYDEKHCRIYFDAEAEAVVLRWQGFAPSQQFREACDASLALLAERGASKMIADNREAKVVNTQDQEWMQTDWFPRAYEKGYRASAVVVSTDVFNDMSVKKIVNQMDAGKFEVQFFADLDSARAWLRTLGVVQRV